MRDYSQTKMGSVQLSSAVAFEGVTCSTLLRLDNSAAMLGLSEQLNELHGFTLKQIGDMNIP